MITSIRINLAFIFLVSILACTAQDSLFVKGNRPYLEIENGTLVNDSIVWGGIINAFRIPIGFKYEFLGKTFDSVNIESTGRLVFDDDHLFFADAFSEISLQDFGLNKGKSLSPITYESMIAKSGKILVIQFKNASFANDSLSELNFQIRLYEGTNDFELHMGTTKINNFSKAFMNGPFSAIYKVISFGPLVFDYRLAIYGCPLTPQMTLDSGEGLNPFEYKLTDVPAEGTVFRFKTTLSELK